MDLPTVLYRCPGPHSRAGGTYDFLGVETEESYEAAIAKGWQLTMPDAIAVFEGKAAEPPVKGKPGPKPKARG